MPSEQRENESAVLAWQTLLTLRNEDLRLVWTRSSVLIALHAGLFAVHAALVDASAGVWGVIGVDVAGLVLAIAWARIAYSGVYYQRYWQNEMANLEDEVLDGFQIWTRLHARVGNEPRAWSEKRKEDLRWMWRRLGEDPEVRDSRMPVLGGVRYRSMASATTLMPWIVASAWLIVLAARLI